jgi:putative nucleotidyltransferase with HDIG domain
VNGAYFAETSVASVEHAIAQLGVGILRTLVITAHLFSTAEESSPIPGFSLKAIQEHSVLTANVARQLFVEAPAAEEAFTAALLHDIGKIVLALGMPERVAEIAALARQDGVAEQVKEIEVLGVTHAVVGGYLLGLWGLPLSIVEAVAFHHTPPLGSQRGFDVAAAVYVANALVNDQARVPAETEDATCSVEVAHLERLGVAERLSVWIAIAASEVQKHARGAVDASVP